MTTTVVKTSLKKNKFASFQTLSHLFEAAKFVKCRRFLLEMNYLAVSKRERKILGKPCCWHCRYLRCRLFVSYLFKPTGRLVIDNLRFLNSFWVSILNNNPYGFSTMKKRLFKNWRATRLGSRMFAVVVVVVYLYISSMKSSEFTFTIPSIAAVITKAEFSGWSIIFVIAWFEEQKI